MGALEKCRGTKNPPRPKIWPAIPVGSGIKLDRKDRKTERWSRGIGEACYCESEPVAHGTWTFMVHFYHIIDIQPNFSLKWRLFGHLLTDLQNPDRTNLLRNPDRTVYNTFRYSNGAMWCAFHPTVQNNADNIDAVKTTTIITPKIRR